MSCEACEALYHRTCLESKNACPACLAAKEPVRVVLVPGDARAAGRGIPLLAATLLVLGIGAGAALHRPVAPVVPEDRASVAPTPAPAATRAPVVRPSPIATPADNARPSPTAKPTPPPSPTAKPSPTPSPSATPPPQERVRWLPPMPGEGPVIAPLRIVTRAVNGARRPIDWEVQRPAAALPRVTPRQMQGAGYSVTDLDLSLQPRHPVEVTLTGGPFRHLFFALSTDDAEASAVRGQLLTIEVAHGGAFTTLPGYLYAGSPYRYHRITSPVPFDRLRITMGPDGPPLYMSNVVAVEEQPPPGQLRNGLVDLTVVRIDGNQATVRGSDGATAEIPLIWISRALHPCRMVLCSPDLSESVTVEGETSDNDGVFVRTTAKSNVPPSARQWFGLQRTRAREAAYASPWTDGIAAWTVMTRWQPPPILDRVKVAKVNCFAALDASGLAQMTLECLGPGKDGGVPNLWATQGSWSLPRLERFVGHLEHGCPSRTSSRCRRDCNRDQLEVVRAENGLKSFTRFAREDVLAPFSARAGTLPPIRVGEKLVATTGESSRPDLCQLTANRATDGRVTLSTFYREGGTASVPESLVPPRALHFSRVWVTIARPWDGPAQVAIAEPPAPSPAPTPAEDPADNAERLRIARVNRQLALGYDHPPTAADLPRLVAKLAPGEANRSRMETAAAAEVLGQLGREAGPALPRLKERARPGADDEDGRIAAACAMALCSIAATSPSTDSQLAALIDPDARKAGAALATLVALGPGAVVNVDPAARALAHLVHEWHVPAVHALATAKPDDTWSQLLLDQLDGKPEPMRRAALEVLAAAMDHGPNVYGWSDRVWLALADRDPVIRRAAVQVLAREIAIDWNHPNRLAVMLEDPDPTVRTATAQVLDSNPDYHEAARAILGNQEGVR